MTLSDARNRVGTRNQRQKLLTVFSAGFRASPFSGHSGEGLEAGKQGVSRRARFDVSFTSDNGGQTRHGAINFPLRGGKGTTFEGGMRVPTIAWWPGQILAGSQTDEITSMMDILPTFVKLAGGALPQDRKIDGGDVWPILKGEDNAESPYQTFYYYRGLKLQAVREGAWKLHLANGQLYNLEDDIAESKNIAQAHPEIVARLRELAMQTETDLGMDGVGPGCRKLGKAANARPLINHEGTIREGFSPTETTSRSQ